MQAKFVDISHHNVIAPSEFPLHEVDGAIIKATEGDFLKDTRFEEHVELFLEHGKIVYPYHFYRTQYFNTRTKKYVGKVSPVGQAQYFLDHIAQYKGDIHGLANDFENPFYWWNDPRYPYNKRIGTEARDLERFHKTWYDADQDIHKIIYTNSNSWNTTLKVTDVFGRGPAWITNKPYLSDTTGLWIAAWYTMQPRVLSPFKKWFFHQFTNEWKIDGERIPGVYTESTPPRPRAIDGNRCALTNEQWRAFVGADVLPPPPPPDPPPPDPPAPPDANEEWNAAIESGINSLEELKK